MSRWNLSHPEEIKAMQRKYYLANKSAVIERAIKWRSENHEHSKALGRKRYARNREHMLEVGRKWRAANPEVARKMLKKANVKWRRQNRIRVLGWNQQYRARKRGVGIDNDCSERIEELKTCELCFWCKVKMDIVTIDHVIPLAHGGEHTPENLVAACPKCNCSKKDKLPSEWLKEAA